MEKYPSVEELGMDVYISGLSPESKALLDDIKQILLDIEDPEVSKETYERVSLQIGMLMAEHPELGRVPPNVLFCYCGLTPIGVAERAWIEGGEFV